MNELRHIYETRLLFLLKPAARPIHGEVVTRRRACANTARMATEVQELTEMFAASSPFPSSLTTIFRSPVFAE